MSLRKRLGTNLRSLRKLKGFSQNKLAEISGVNHNHIGSIENGHVAASVDILESLCIALEIDPCFLLAKTSVKLKGTGIKEVQLIPIKIKKGEAAYCFWTDEGMEFHPLARGNFRNAITMMALLQANGFTGKDLLEQSKRLHIPIS